VQYKPRRPSRAFDFRLNRWLTAASAPTHDIACKPLPCSFTPLGLPTLIALTGRVEGLEIRMSAIEAWSVDTTRRLDRIERRLDLVQVP
jgi:hypothetical protein